MKANYKLMGNVYDLVGSIYSGRQLPLCKEAMLDHVRPDDEVLFAGVGHGKEVVKAAKLGAKVTVVDLSETMLGKMKKNIASNIFKHPIHQIQDDILNVSGENKYDFVFANFFLNVFKRDQMERVVAHMADLSKPGGYVVVGDFAFPEGGIFSRIVQRLYWYIAVSLFFLVTKNAFHNIYNYPEYLIKYGLQVTSIKYYKLLKMNCYRSVLAKKSP